MSTIDGYWLSFGTPTVAKGRSVRFVVFLQPSGGVLIGCARNRKSFMHMVAGFDVSETSTNYSRTLAYSYFNVSHANSRYIYLNVLYTYSRVQLFQCVTRVLSVHLFQCVIHVLSCKVTSMCYTRTLGIVISMFFSILKWLHSKKPKLGLTQEFVVDCAYALWVVHTTERLVSLMLLKGFLCDSFIYFIYRMLDEKINRLVM